MHTALESTDRADYDAETNLNRGVEEYSEDFSEDEGEGDDSFQEAIVSGVDQRTSKGYSCSNGTDYQNTLQENSDNEVSEWPTDGNRGNAAETPQGTSDNSLEEYPTNTYNHMYGIQAVDSFQEKMDHILDECPTYGYGHMDGAEAADSFQRKADTLLVDCSTHGHCHRDDANGADSSQGKVSNSFDEASDGNSDIDSSQDKADNNIVRLACHDSRLDVPGLSGNIAPVGVSNRDRSKVEEVDNFSPATRGSTTSLCYTNPLQQDTCVVNQQVDNFTATAYTLQAESILLRQRTSDYDRPTDCACSHNWSSDESTSATTGSAEPCCSQACYEEGGLDGNQSSMDSNRRSGMAAYLEHDAIPTSSGSQDSASSPGQLNPVRRPKSAHAGRVSKLEQQMEERWNIHVTHWSVAQVCDWIVYIGMGQYRKKFVHHCINGKLLCKLTDTQLRVELGIGPLGHREELLSAIRQLEAKVAVGSTSPLKRLRIQRPASASPALMKAQVAVPSSPSKLQDYRAKLEHDKKRALAKASTLQAAAQKAARNAELAAEAVKQVQGLIKAFDSKASISCQSGDASSPKASCRHRGGSAVVDGAGSAPWNHVGPKSAKYGLQDNELCYVPTPMENGWFKPTITERSKQLVSDSNGYFGGAKFLERVERDLQSRKKNVKELEQLVYSPERIMNDPTLRRKHAERDAGFLRQAVLQNCGEHVVAEVFKDGTTVDGAIDELVRTYQHELGITDDDVDAVAAAGMDKKVAKLAAAIRTAQFINRYKADLDGKEAKMKQLRHQWSGTKGDKAHRELEECRHYFTGCGWPGDDFEHGHWTSIADRCDALLARTKTMQAAKASGSTVDWSSHRSDGLEDMQQEYSREHPAGKGSRRLPHKHQLATGNHLEQTIALLAKCKTDDLTKLSSLQGQQKAVSIYRAIRTVRFMEFTEQDLRQREDKLLKAWKELDPKANCKRVSKEEMDAFYNRLLEDTERRKQIRTQMIKDAEAAQFHQAPQAKAAKSSAPPAPVRPTSARLKKH